MIVVSDTSPPNYLNLIDEIELLVELYREVIVPPAVVDELSASGAPGKVRQWIDGTPQWLTVRPVDVVDAALTRLGLGEHEAITLASELEAEPTRAATRAPVPKTWRSPAGWRRRGTRSASAWWIT